MEVELPEPAAKIEVLLVGQVLVAEEDDEVLGQRAMDLVHLAVRRRAQVDAADLAADNRRQFVDADRLIGRVFRGVLDPRAAKAAQRTLHPGSPVLALLAEHAAKDRVDML